MRFFVFTVHCSKLSVLNRLKRSIDELNTAWNELFADGDPLNSSLLPADRDALQSLPSWKAHLLVRNPSMLKFTNFGGQSIQMCFCIQTFCAIFKRNELIIYQDWDEGLDHHKKTKIKLNFTHHDLDALIQVSLDIFDDISFYSFIVYHFYFHRKTLGLWW